MKIPVAVLGATGLVGKTITALLADHPWFTVVALAASEESVGSLYGEFVPDSPYANLPIVSCRPNFSCPLVFSALDASIAGDIELNFAQAGIIVVSNARNHRLDPDVPLLIPEVNGHQLTTLKKNIVTNPNCSVTGLVLALKPLHDAFGIDKINVTTLQAISGAGRTTMDIADNVIPYIVGEEEKIETEPLKILGDSTIKISAQCHRVPVTDGHLAAVSIAFYNNPSQDEILERWETFTGDIGDLPTAPERPLHYFSDPMAPQPKLHRDLGEGMTVSLGRLRPCPVLDYKFNLLSHNRIRGAAGSALLNAELLVSKGMVPSALVFLSKSELQSLGVS